jgi:alpha-L-fucosidase
VVRFAPTPRSLRTHPVPAWFEEAKLGIFVHWGLASIPAWAPRAGALPELLRNRYDEAFARLPYAEWYWNALRLPGSPAARHHAETYRDAPYRSFRAPFESMLKSWDPAPWADLFAASGARYVVQVTKHHDGFCLWPAAATNPRERDWAATRDTVGELAAAVRARGLRFGVYYSGGLDWTFEPRPIRTLADGFAAVPLEPAYERYVDAHYRELIERIRPSVLWNDIAYPPHRGALWRLFADYYETVEEGVVNDRFLPASALGVRALRTSAVRALADALARRSVRAPDYRLVPPRPPHCDFRTPEYASFPDATAWKWEATRGIGHSFGFNRNEDERSLIDPDELVRSFVDVVSKNGNLLLNVGPTGEGEIHPRERARLEALGAWLRTNGEAVYATRPWRRPEGTTREGVPLRFTWRPAGSAPEVVYATLLGTPPPGELRIRDFAPSGRGEARLLGHGPVSSRAEGSDRVVAWPRGLPASPAWALAWEAGAGPPTCARSGAR